MAGERKSFKAAAPVIVWTEPDRSEELIGRHGGADVHRHTTHKIARQVGRAHLDRNFIAQVGVLDIFEHPHDFHVQFSGGIDAKPRVASDCVSS